MEKKRVLKAKVQECEERNAQRERGGEGQREGERMQTHRQKLLQKLLVGKKGDGQKLISMGIESVGVVEWTDSN